MNAIAMIERCAQRQATTEVMYVPSLACEAPNSPEVFVEPSDHGLDGVERLPPEHTPAAVWG